MQFPSASDTSHSEDREKAARLACMFNSIYKTLKNLNDELITKKKKLSH